MDKASLIKFYTRYDVLFGIAALFAASGLAYADQMPWYLPLVLLLVRDAAGYVGMLAKTKPGAE